MRALALFAVDPAGTGGVALRAPPGLVRDSWLAMLARCAPGEAGARKIPINASDDRLLGGLDLAATLQSGRPVFARGMLAEADGGIVVLAMAERCSPAMVARLTAVMDTGHVTVARDLATSAEACRIGIVALDEGGEDEAVSPALLDRLACPIDFSALSHRDIGATAPDIAQLELARTRLGSVAAGADVVEALCKTALALGLLSLRPPLLALRVARAACALDGRGAVSMQDAALAARLVLAPRATALPADPGEPPPASETPPENRAETADPADEDRFDPDAAEIVLRAALAAIPSGLLARLAGKGDRASPPGRAGRVGDAQKSARQGRPAGIRAAMPRQGARLNVIETLRAAAPWQRLRAGGRQGLIEIRREDFRVTKLEQRSTTTTIFVVDASGSSALNRLAEAKGAVELLLAECYARRDQVAVLAFRGKGAQLLLPPTRSLVRAKSCLAVLPGGGATPLASGIEAGFLLALSIRRGGGTPTLVMLTDGRPNMARDGHAGRAAAERDAAAVARLVRAAGFAALLIDTSPRPSSQAETLAADMGARYLPLPYADAVSLSRTIQAAGAPRR